MAERKYFMRRMTNFWAFIIRLAGLIGFTGDKIEIGNDLDVDGDLKVNSNAKLFENIVDKNNHSRFTEGPINTIQKTGVTYTYAKWSLSGSHLMIVLSGVISENTTFGQEDLATLSLPEWISEKLYTIHSQTTLLNMGDMYIREGLQNSTKTCIITKPESGDLIISFRDSFQSESLNTGFRLQFDFLIDNA